MGAGRKPFPKDERRDSKVMLRFTEAERREAEAAAGDEALGVFIRRIVLRYLARRK